MGNNTTQSLLHMYQAYIEPYLNPGASRGAYGSFSFSSFQEKKPSGKTKKKKSSKKPLYENMQETESHKETPPSQTAPDINQRTPQGLESESPTAPPTPAGTTIGTGTSAKGRHGYYACQSPAQLQKAIVWSEILGEPVSKKRRRKRMGQ